jgi:ribose/xylose/arabinose/galactoside ABC-type transport system permease subunit
MLAVVAGLVVIGVLQGAIVSAGLNPVLTTLAAGAIIFGVVAELTEGRVIRMGANRVGWGNDEVLGLPLEVIVFVVVTAAVTVLIGKTVIGRQTLLTGSNADSAEISGISFRNVTIVAFVIFSIGLSIAGILNAGGFGQGEINSLSTLTIDSIAALLVGGVAIAGGEGSPLRSAAGAILIAMISNIMVLNDFSTGGRLAVQGGVVVIVVILLELLRHRRSLR